VCVSDRESADESAARAAFEADDLLLAEACARGENEALVAFDRLYGADLDLAIRKSPSLGVTPDEFRQIFREHVFVAPDPERPPRIASFSQRGALRAWVRVTATRLVVDLSRKPDVPEPMSDDDLSARLAQTGADPELDYLRHAYGVALPDAFREGLQALTVRQRNLLRQRYLHDLGADKLAVLYGVHRATMFAWIEEARAALLDRVRAAMLAKVSDASASEASMQNLVAALGSRLDLSVRRLLESQLEPEKKPRAPRRSND
jgi:RNA polymerase sigma-70 factor (ECF subfamily)